MTLLDLSSGETAHILSLEGGSSFISRLNAQGIHKGRQIRKISGSGGHGPVIIEVMGSKLAIGRGMAGRIKVKPTQ